MTPRKHILIVTGQLVIGGAERELVTFLAEAVGRVHDFSVLCLGAGGAFREDVERLTGRAVASPPTSSRLRRWLWMRKTVEGLRPDLIHAWNLTPMFYLKTAFVRRPCPIVGFLQNVPAQSLQGDRHRWLFRYLVRAPSGLVSNSRAALEDLEAMGVEVSRSVVIHNAVSGEFLEGRLSREAEAARRGHPVVVAAGRLIERKRADWMIRAVRVLRAQGCACDLWLLGDGPERERLERLAGSEGVGEHVRFWGMRRDVAAILRTADIFLHCAWAEGLPNAVQEAMACGLPIVAPRTSGIPEIVSEGKQGLLFGIDDFDACVAHLKRLLDDEPFRRTLGRASVSRARNDFRASVMAGKMLDFYESVLSAET